MKILKQGSKDTLVLTLKRILNNKGMVAHKLAENDSFDADTAQAIRHFQKRSRLKEDGIVGPKTAVALAKLAGHGATSFAAALGGGEAAAGQRRDVADEPRQILPVNGKTYVFTKQEFERFNKDMVSALKRTQVVTAEQRVVAARTYWDTFHDLNKDQYVVSWFVSALGPKLPDESIIKSGEQAYEALKGAVNSGDFKKIEDQLGKCVAPINKAHQTMIAYRENVIGGAGNIVTVLDFTRDTSFEICSAIAQAELGGAPGSGAISGGGAELVKSCANEFGKYIAGTSGGGEAALRNVVVDGLLGAATGAAGDLMKLKGDKVIEGVAESAVKKLMTNKWAARVGADRVKKLMTRGLKGAMKGALESAVKNASKIIKGNMTPAQFFEEIAKDAGFGTFLDGLDEWILSKKFATIVFEKSPLSRIKLGKVTKAEAIKILQDVIQDKGNEGIKKSLELVVEKIKGNEKEEEVGEDVAEEFARSYVKNIEGEVAKRIKKT
jgi:hypothetical protein